jgi:putative hydrolase of the HAD superfamily
MLRTVVFDLGNVLLHFSHERMCRQIGAACGKDWDEVWKRLFDDGWELAFERGKLTPAEFQQRFERWTGHDVSFERLYEAASDIFQLNAPIVPIVDALKSRGLRLVLLSNTHVWHIEHVRRHWDILDRFDDLVLSYEVGAVKPEPAIFEGLLGRLGCAPGEAFYTDDIARYVDVGRSYGLDAELFTDAAALREQLASRGVVMK